MLSCHNRLQLHVNHPAIVSLCNIVEKREEKGPHTEEDMTKMLAGAD